jgi:hypothetical protein
MNNLYAFIELIREKPYLYIGDSNFSTLCNNINGYQLYCFINNVNENLNPDWGKFQDFVALKLNYSESTSGFKNMILERNDFDEHKSLISFYDLFDLFRKD